MTCGSRHKEQCHPVSVGTLLRLGRGGRVETIHAFTLLLYSGSFVVPKDISVFFYLSVQDGLPGTLVGGLFPRNPQGRAQLKIIPETPFNRHVSRLRCLSPPTTLEAGHHQRHLMLQRLSVVKSPGWET